MTYWMVCLRNEWRAICRLRLYQLSCSDFCWLWWHHFLYLSQRRYTITRATHLYPFEVKLILLMLDMVHCLHDHFICLDLRSLTFQVQGNITFASRLFHHCKPLSHTGIILLGSPLLSFFLELFSRLDLRCILGTYRLGKFPLYILLFCLFISV